MRWPKYFVAPATIGTAIRESSAICVLMRNIMMNAPTTTISDDTECMTAGPMSMRTDDRSFVARDIRSPVCCSW